MKLELQDTVTEFLVEPINIEEVKIDSCEPQIRGLVESVGLSTEDLLNADKWLVCEKNGILVGCMAVEFRSPLVHIQSLSVDKKFRRQGMARKMVEYGFDNFVNSGEAMTALTLFWNIKFYEKIGFGRVDAKEIKQADDVTRREKHKYCTAMLRLKE